MLKLKKIKAYERKNDIKFRNYMKIHNSSFPR